MYDSFPIRHFVLRFVRCSNLFWIPSQPRVLNSRQCCCEIAVSMLKDILLCAKRIMLTLLQPTVLTCLYAMMFPSLLSINP